MVIVSTEILVAIEFLVEVASADPSFVTNLQSMTTTVSFEISAARMVVPRLAKERAMIRIGAKPSSFF